MILVAMEGEMKIREPRAGGMAFLWLWAVFFGGVPMLMLFMGTDVEGNAPPLFLLLFPAVAVAVLIPMVRRSMRAGFHLEQDGIRGAHDAETTVVPWADIDRIVWRWSEQTSNVKVNGRPLPDGYALHAVLRDGRAVRLMQRVAARYGQQQDLNDQMARAGTAGVLPVPFDATIPTHGEGEWSGTPPPRSHSTWDADDLPPAVRSPLERGGSAPHWPTG